jgi:hypothetical protein
MQKQEEAQPRGPVFGASVLSISRVAVTFTVVMMATYGVCIMMGRYWML